MVTEPQKPILPDFDDPPAVETLLGIHFKPLTGWTVPHFGLFWHDIRAEYPQVEVRPPLAAEVGLKFEIDVRRAQFELSSELPVRCWFIHKSGTRLIQVQNSSFIQNWRKESAEARYLHYDDLKPSFVETWDIFQRFLQRNGVEQPSISECEVTYINHIDRGRGWKEFAELPHVVPSWSGATTDHFLPSPVSVSIDAFYPIAGNAGRLEVLLQPGVRKADSKETIQLVLTARCKPQSSENAELLKCLDLGREWVVRGFADFTSRKMHEIWGRRERKEEKE